MRKISAIVVHGTWTLPHLDIGAEEIRNWHVNENGWSDIGYHKVIRRSGVVESGRPVEIAGAHVKGHNHDTLGICLVGGREADRLSSHVTDEQARQELLWEFNYSADQILALIQEVEAWQHEFDVKDVFGHRDYRGVTKRCPGFDVKAFFS